MTDRVAAVDGALDRLLGDERPPVPPLARDQPLRPGYALTAGAAIELFTDQYRSRALDIAARRLKAAGTGYYTISSAGHEMNALVAAATRPSDPALLHYRAGAFVMARSRQVAGTDPVLATALSLTAARDDPASGGRHKVWGSRELWIAPQTSTIASHLPKAVGLATFLRRAADTELPGAPPSDAVVVCSFGDGSANHASALTAINAARYARRLGRPMPLIFVCEDNGLSISVPTPARWVGDTFSGLPHLRYVRAEGEVEQVHAAVAEAVDTARRHAAAVFLHLPTVRLWGHAGSDLEAGYRSRDRILADESRDPILAVARRLLDTGAVTPGALAGVVARVRDEVAEAAEEAARRPHLTSRDDVVATLAPYDEAATRAAADAGSVAADLAADGAAAPTDATRRELFGGTLPERATAATNRTLAAHLNAALHDALLADAATHIFGEDVAHKGGVYGITQRLHERFGSQRVFDTLLDETMILGLAQGAGILGLLPVPEIQYLAYVHNALDQIRGEAASLSFFSDGRFTNPMVVRIAAFAYQKGFGGHFHNDNSVAALLDIPGLVVVTPSHGPDAARVLRGALALARANGRVVCLLEPIALYHERDLYEPGDGGWLGDYPPPPASILPGEVGVHGDLDAEVVVFTYANGVRMSLRAARAAQVRARIVDLRWLSPLPWAAIHAEVGRARQVMIVDECRAAGGIADRLHAGIVRRDPHAAVTAVSSADSYIPLGPAADAVLLGEDEIASALEAARRASR